MTQTPIASIVMVTYNHAPYIARAIEGVLQQKTTFPFELIIGEDCSTDNTLEIVTRYQRAHPDIIHVITAEKNVGGKQNHRRCESACRGEYICYCEGDDFWTDPGKLERQVRFLQANPDYAMVHTAFGMLYDETGRFVARPMELPNDLNDADAFNEILSGKRIVWTLTVCVRRAILEPILRDCPECYDKRYLMGDTQRWLEISHRGKVKYFPESMATRRALRESASRSTNPARTLRFAISNKELLDHYVNKYGCSPEAKKRAMARCAFSLLIAAYAAGDVQVASSALADYRNAGVRVPVEGYLYYLGSRSPVWRSLVRPALAITIFCGKAFRRLIGIIKTVK